MDIVSAAIILNIIINYISIRSCFFSTQLNNNVNSYTSIGSADRCLLCLFAPYDTATLVVWMVEGPLVLVGGVTLVILKPLKVQEMYYLSNSEHGNRPVSYGI